VVTIMVKKLIRKKFSGLAVVEAALVLPLLLLVSLGAIKYGHLFLKAQQITNAARNGARTAIRVDADNDIVIAQVDSLMGAAGMPIYTLTLTPGNVSSQADPPVIKGQSVTVQIVVLAENVDILRVPLFPNPDQLGARVAMVKEGF